MIKKNQQTTKMWYTIKIDGFCNGKLNWNSNKSYVQHSTACQFSAIQFYTKICEKKANKQVQHYTYSTHTLYRTYSDSEK